VSLSKVFVLGVVLGAFAVVLHELGHLIAIMLLIHPTFLKFKLTLKSFVSIYIMYYPHNILADIIIAFMGGGTVTLVYWALAKFAKRIEIKAPLYAVGAIQLIYAIFETLYVMSLYGIV